MTGQLLIAVTANSLFILLMMVLQSSDPNAGDESSNVKEKSCDKNFRFHEVDLQKKGPSVALRTISKVLFKNLISKKKDYVEAKMGEFFSF